MSHKKESRKKRSKHVPSTTDAEVQTIDNRNNMLSDVLRIQTTLASLKTKEAIEVLKDEMVGVLGSQIFLKFEGYLVSRTN